MSTKTQAHTPGPWRIVFPVDCMLGYVYGPKHPDGGDYAPLFETGNRANAHLIAAAPDLLATLERIAYKPYGLSNASAHDILDTITADAKAAIAKVKEGAA